MMQKSITQKSITQKLACSKKASTLIREFDPGGAEHVLETYLKLHEGKIGMHWLWMAITRIVAGETELDVMHDYGYADVPTWVKEPLVVDRGTLVALRDCVTEVLARPTTPPWGEMRNPIPCQYGKPRSNFSNLTELLAAATAYAKTAAEQSKGQPSVAHMDNLNALLNAAVRRGAV